VGFVPVAGVGSDSGEGSGLQRGAAGGEGDVASVGVELDAACAVELAQGPLGAEVLVCVVGVADVGLGKGLFDEGFDDGGVYADGDVAADSLFGPVADGPQAREVFEDPESGLGVGELAVRGDDPRGAGRGGCEAGGEHVAAREELFVLEGVVVVVVEEPAFGDVEVEEPPGAAVVVEDALRGPPYVGLTTCSLTGRASLPAISWLPVRRLTLRRCTCSGLASTRGALSACASF